MIDKAKRGQRKVKVKEVTLDMFPYSEPSLRPPHTERMAI